MKVVEVGDVAGSFDQFARKAPAFRPGRMSKIQLLNLQGAGYTNRHGT